LFILFILISYILLKNKYLLKHLLKNYLNLFSFIIPLLIFKLFFSNEGKIYNFFFLTIYLSGLYDFFLIILRLFIISTCAFIIFKLNNFTDFFKTKNLFLSNIFFLSIYLYQIIINELITLLKNKTLFKIDILNKIDELYIKLKNDNNKLQ